MSSHLADMNTDHERRATTRRDKAIAEAEAKRAKFADDQRIRFERTFTGQATPEQARKTLADIRALCFAGRDAGILSNFETNRTLHILGRQSIALEIDAILNPTTPIPTT